MKSFSGLSLLVASMCFLGCGDHSRRSPAVTTTKSPAPRPTPSPSPSPSPTPTFSISSTNASLPIANDGESYSITLQTTGGTAPYAFSIESGNLPSGLTLSQTTGEIYGAPVVDFNEQHPFGVRVVDSGGKIATKNLTIFSDKLVTITTTTLPAATVGQPYSFQLQATGGTAPYTWEITQGVLPAGLAMDDDGLISGTPTTSGNYPFNVALLDTVGPAPLSQTSTAAGLALTSN